MIYFISLIELPLCPSILPWLLYYIPQDLQGFIQPNLVFALLSFRSSHGCKATHEALHVPIPDLVLKGGHTYGLKKRKKLKKQAPSLKEKENSLGLRA